MNSKKLNSTLDLIPLSKWNEYFDYPSTAALRQLVFYNTNNFTSTVIRKIGKRLYIKLFAFTEWVEKSKGDNNETL